LITPPEQRKGSIEITKLVCAPHGPPTAARILSSEFGIQNSELSSGFLLEHNQLPTFNILSRLQPIEVHSARERCGWHHGRWSRRLEQRYASMIPDEWEKMRNALTAALDLPGLTKQTSPGEYLQGCNEERCFPRHIPYGGGASMPHPFVLTMNRARYSPTNASTTINQTGYSLSPREK
jgi:hypothetical protein